MDLLPFLLIFAFSIRIICNPDGQYWNPSTEARSLGLTHSNSRQSECSTYLQQQRASACRGSWRWCKSRRSCPSATSGYLSHHPPQPQLSSDV